MTIAILFLCYAIICWHHPRAALGLLLALLPTYLLRFDVGGIPMTVLEGFILILAAAVLVWRRGGAMIPPPPDWRGRSRGGGVVGAPVFAGGGSYNATPSLSPSTAEEEKQTAVRASSPFADRMVVLAVAWLIAGTLAAFGSDAGLRAWGIWKAYIVEPVFLYATMRALRTQLNPRMHVVFPLLIGAAGVAAIAVWQYWTGYGIPYPWQTFATRRVTSVFGYPNAVGLYLAPLVPLALGLMTVLRRGTPPLTPPLEEGENRNARHTLAATAFAAAVVLVAIVAVFFTRGTGAMAAVIAALASLPFLVILKRWFARHARRSAIAIVITWVVVCLALTAVLPYQPERPRTGSNAWQSITFQQWSGSVRLSQYREVWRLLRDHPIRGAGLSGYPQAIQHYKEKQDVETFQYPHNLLLAVWSEMGLLGLLVFLAITATFFARAFSQRRPATVIAAMLAILVFGLVDIPIFKNDLAALWWTILALGTVPFAKLEQSV